MWAVIGLVLILLAAVLMLALSPGLRMSMGLEQQVKGPQPDLPLRPAPRKPASGGSGAAAKAASPATAQAGKAEVEPEATGSKPLAVPAVATEEGKDVRLAAGTAPAAGTDAAANAEGPQPVAAKEPEAVAPASPPEAAKESAEEGLLAPLAKPAPTPASQKVATQVKRTQSTKTQSTKKVRSPPRATGKGPTELQKEWRETNMLFQRLKQRHSCSSLGLLCARHLDLKNEVEAAGDAHDDETLRKVLAMQGQLELKMAELQ